MYRITATSILVVVAFTPWAMGALAEEELKNDGWFSGAGAGFQAGFVSGEIGAVRLTPSMACPCDLKKVSLLYGGSGVQQTFTLRIYDDDAGATPGTLLHSGNYQLTGNDTTLQDIALSSAGLSVSGAFWVGIEFQHAGVPSIARDNDGNIDASENYIFTGGWFESALLGVTGDWVIRATVTEPGFSVGGTVAGLSGSLTLQNNGGDDLVISGDGGFTFPGGLADLDSYLVTVLSAPADHQCTVTNGSGSISAQDVTDVSISCVAAELRNDGWQSGAGAAFQAGFAPGEIAAARFFPQGCPCDLANVRVLFGGTPGSQLVTLRVWDDAAGTDDPGSEIYSGQYNLADNDTDLTTIDLSTEGIIVTGPFRVGLDFSVAGLPSIAADTDGNLTAGRNFLFASGVGWHDSAFFGLTGDWILRAGLAGSVGGSVWEDQNGDGLHGAGEPPLVFVPVHLLDHTDTLVDVTFTDLAGDYSFETAQTAPVRVEFPAPAGYLHTTPDQGSDENLDSDASQVTGRTELIAPPFLAEDAVDWSAGLLQIGPCFVPDEQLYLYNVRLSTDGNSYPILDFVDFNQPEQVTGYNIYRSSDAGLDPALWPRVADDIVDGFESVPDLQWVDLSGDVAPGGVWYYDLAPFNSACGAEGPR